MSTYPEWDDGNSDYDNEEEFYEIIVNGLDEHTIFMFGYLSNEAAKKSESNVVERINQYSTKVWDTDLDSVMDRAADSILYDWENELDD